MELHSDSFDDGGTLPASVAFGVHDEDTHIAFGSNRNPHLAWSDLPEGTASLALICHDRDVPSKPDDVNQEGREVPADLPRIDYYHWVVIDIPPDLAEIDEGAFAQDVVPRGRDTSESPHGTRQGINDYTSWFAGDPDMEGTYMGYDGPCPPFNDSIPHHYTFALYALDVDRLDLDDGFTGPDVERAMVGHVLDRAAIMGTYAINPDVAG
jgi:Raf kinase inhibitor-like YbhB/YbcL family protein